MTPADAFLLFIVGVLALYWELARPGRLIPGLAGCVLAVAGGWFLWQNSPTATGIGLSAAAFCLFLAEVFSPIDWLAGIAATAALACGFCVLFPAPRQIPLALAIPVSMVFGGITVFLAYGAKCARRNKRSDISAAKRS